MIRRTAAFISAVIAAALCMLPPGAYASDRDETLPYFYDEVGLLSASQAESLENQLRGISMKQNVCVAVAVVSDTGGQEMASFADDLYDYNGFGYTAARDGAMLVVSMNDREWFITTRGYGITAMTGNGRAYLMDQVQPLLTDGKYYEAFTKFASETDSYITQAKDGKPFNPRNDVPWLIGSFIGGIASAAGTVFYQRSKNRTVRAKDEAADYVRSGSLRVTNQNDIFLFRNVTRTRIERDSGDNDTRTSSSGAVHGGSGGHF